jgi:uncharacterized cupin superfamily protein
VSRTSWGEESRVRIGPADSGGQLTILDYRAPAGFGPPRHLHHWKDEAFELIEGQAVVWTPDLSPTVSRLGAICFLIVSFSV